MHTSRIRAAVLLETNASLAFQILPLNDFVLFSTVADVEPPQFIYYYFIVFWIRCRHLRRRRPSWENPKAIRVRACERTFLASFLLKSNICRRHA